MVGGDGREEGRVDIPVRAMVRHLQDVDVEFAHPVEQAVRILELGTPGERERDVRLAAADDGDHLLALPRRGTAADHLVRVLRRRVSPTN